MPRLELTWIGKDQQPRLEPRILLENPDLRCGNPDPDGAWQGMLIHGDNLLALKALEADYAGQVKCIYIDPPYNTGSAFTHYDDGLEHSLWLSLIRDRLVLLRNLLRDDGSIWISIDDNECHYLKVLCDEVFGRGNFVATVLWQKKYAAKSDSKYLSESHEFILVYSRNLNNFQINRLPRTEEQNARYKNQDNDPRGPWTSGDLLRNEARDYAIFPIVSPKTGKSHMPPPGTSWRFNDDKIKELIEDSRIWFGEDGNNVPRLKRFLSDVSDGIPSTTWWAHTEVGHNDEAKKEVTKFNSDDIFSTPKPERLIQRILTLATNPGDLVLDSFLGSGTTAAVAHKMGRRWIGIELGEHAYTHCAPRLRKVVRGEDQGGISKAVSWQGGGGFRFYTLAPTLLRQDGYGQWVINPEYNAPMLAAAVAKHEGFRYAPDAEVWWKQARSAEKDYLLVTTQYVNRPLLDAIRADMAGGETLLVCCKAFDAPCARLYPEISVKKIPNMLVDRCEFGRDDYSLHIVNLPNEPEPPEEPDAPLGMEIDDETEEKARQGKLFE